jgi:carbonyl reductase 1
VNLYATSRAGTDLGITTQRPDHKVTYASLDISDSASIANLDKTLSDAKQPIDILINNAGVNLDAPGQQTYENAVKTLDVNYRGTLAMCQMVLPHTRDGSRIVSLSSVGSLLKPYSDELKQRFRTVRTLAEVEELAHEYEQAAKDNTIQQKGWPGPGKSYSVSKSLINAFTRILAEGKDGVQINCCCPGWVETDMGKMVGSSPPKTLEEGAKIPVRLALGDAGGVTGIYWANDSIKDRGEGHVQEW